MEKPAHSIQIGPWQAELLPRAPYRARYTTSQPVIGFSFDAQDGVHAFATDRKEDFQASANGLAYVCAGCDVYSESAIGGEYLRIECGDLKVNSGVVDRHFSNVIDRVAISAAFRLRRSLLTADMPDVLECEQALLALESCTVASINEHRFSETRAVWMTVKRLKRIDDYVEARLEYKLTVGEIASEFGLSTAYFSREFKKASGRTPHQYIVDKRLFRARALLQQSHHNLSAIALECGFASHSHMTKHFRASLGVTPNSLRGARKKFNE